MYLPSGSEVSMETGDNPAPVESDQIAEASKESIAKVKSLVDDLKVIQEYEKGLVA